MRLKLMFNIWATFTLLWSLTYFTKAIAFMWNLKGIIDSGSVMFIYGIGAVFGILLSSLVEDILKFIKKPEAGNQSDGDTTSS